MGKDDRLREFISTRREERWRLYEAIQTWKEARLFAHSPWIELTGPIMFGGAGLKQLSTLCTCGQSVIFWSIWANSPEELHMLLDQNEATIQQVSDHNWEVHQNCATIES